ncbi:beta-lactamase family protein [Chitinophaga skermanii]|uniref:beta-lactamase n=1 Tax=Chitinophaga skermanii TaxID=331697 RepID=A0A327R2X1_9BACT|nr:serine hydrolase [Chitinophaga skermanii]RAJ10408.1 beta-lactamase family protein [Chitinophaga skermanii]
MKRILLLTCMIINAAAATAQEQTDSFLVKLLMEKGSPKLKHILQHPDSFQYQIIYTKIDYNRYNTPTLHNYCYAVNKDKYFNPASTVKMPMALMALELMNQERVKGLNKYTRMEVQNARTHAASYDSSIPSIAQYIRKVFLVSDNDAYNQLFEFVGLHNANKMLHAKGYPNSRILRRFAPIPESENLVTRNIQFYNKKGKLVVEKQATISTYNYDKLPKVFVGKGRWNSQDSLINEPMDFTRHNTVPLLDLQQILTSIIFPQSVPLSQRFQLTGSDTKLLLTAMSELPRESRSPIYDTTEFFDSYTKFFFFKDGRQKIPSNIRVFNKTGWSYGYLTDVAYIVDFEHEVDFMLSGTIYVNRDGILNDNKYEYEELGYPFFREIGEIIYNYELQRNRAYKPNLNKFRLSYN